MLASVPDRDGARKGVHDEEFRVDGSAPWTGGPARLRGSYLVHWV